MIVPVLLAIVVGSVLLAGGRLTALADVRLQWLPALLVALALQVVALRLVPEWPTALLAGLHVASYGAAGGFVVVNRHVPGLWLIALGGFANFAAIAANGGVMPASPAAMATAGVTPAPGVFVNSAPMEDAALWFLGDIFAIPASGPLSSAFSVGGVLIVLGAALALHRICGSRLVPARWRFSAARTFSATV